MSFQQYNVYPCLSPCRLVATTNQSGSYYNGPLNNGVGATFTYATGALTIDSVDVEVGDSIALVGQTNDNENGIYVCKQAGATGVSAILQRRADMQCIEQIKAGFWTTIGAGTVNAGAAFVIAEPLPAVFGVDDLVLIAMIPAGLGTASTKAASDDLQPSVASVDGATTANALAVFSDTAGTIKDQTTTATLGFGLTISTGDLTLTAGNLAMTAGFVIESAANAITAHAGGGQGSATLLAKQINRVTVVATAGDSVKLPAATAGKVMTVINADAADAMDCFPATGEVINALAANTALSIAANTTVIFFCAVAGVWNSVVTA